jgi:hypothetical protein
MTDEPPFKPVVWVGSSSKDLQEFPDVLQDHMVTPYFSLAREADRGCRLLNQHRRCQLAPSRARGALHGNGGPCSEPSALRRIDNRTGGFAEEPKPLGA